MYRCLRIKLWFLFLPIIGWAQSNNSSHEKVFDTLSTVQKTFTIPPFAILHLNFALKNTYGQDTTFYIDLGKEELGVLYENRGAQLFLIAKTGARVPIPERSVNDDMRAIAIHLKAQGTKKMTLVIQNFLPTPKPVSPQLLSFASYQVKVAERNNHFYQKYWSPGYLSILIVILILTVIQYFVLPERVFIYYFFYLLFTFIRSTAVVEAIVLENWFSVLNKIGYSSIHSQVFTYLSFIFYVLFLREFTSFPSKKPRLDYFFKIQLAYLAVFVVFDLIYPSEKFSNFQLNAVFRMLEVVGLILGVINLSLLFKVYDSFNRFVIIGAVSLYVIGILGQEIVKRTIDANSNPDFFLNTLSIVWMAAYLVEIAFFTIALVNRQRILLKSILFEQNLNKLLSAQLVSQQVQVEQVVKPDHETFSLATNKGVFVFQQSDIVRLEASGNYTIFSIQHHPQTLASYTLSEFERKLDPSKFIRVHKSHVVNLQYVVRYTKGDGGTLTLQDGTDIPVSRSRKEEVLSRLATTVK